MHPLKSRILQFFVFLSFICVIFVYSSFIYGNSHTTNKAFAAAQNLPPDGLAQNDTNGLVPGNPENGRKQLSKLYALYQKYKGFYGTMPSEVVVLATDVLKQPKRYGFANGKEFAEFLANPDHVYSDDEGQRGSAQLFDFGSSPLRPNKTPVYGARTAGQRDVIAYTESYFHRNQRDFPGQRTTLNPVGFYQVLWDDGQIEEIPYDKALYAYTHDAGGRQTKTFYIAFWGQAGVPTDALDYNTYWREKRHWQIPPHGAANGKGTSYNGQSYR